VSLLVLLDLQSITRLFLLVLFLYTKKIQEKISVALFAMGHERFSYLPNKSVFLLPTIKTK
jgi:hypothetical protein